MQNSKENTVSLRQSKESSHKFEFSFNGLIYYLYNDLFPITVFPFLTIYSYYWLLLLFYDYLPFVICILCSLIITYYYSLFTVKILCIVNRMFLPIHSCPKDNFSLGVNTVLVILGLISLHCHPGCNPQSHRAAALQSRSRGHSSEEQGRPASTGRCPGLPAQPHWSQKLRPPQ